MKPKIAEGQAVARPCQVLLCSYALAFLRDPRTFFWIARAAQDNTR